MCIEETIALLSPYYLQVSTYLLIMRNIISLPVRQQCLANMIKVYGDREERVHTTSSNRRLWRRYKLGRSIEVCGHFDGYLDKAPLLLLSSLAANVLHRMPPYAADGCSISHMIDI